MGPSRPVASVLLLLFGILPAGASAADPSATSPVVLGVSVDLAEGVVRSGSAAWPIGLEKRLWPDPADIVVERVSLGGGPPVVHVRVPERGSASAGTAWEALVVPGRQPPIFQGRTGFAAGDPGERTGTALRIVPGTAASRVVLGDLREDVRICGQTETLLNRRVLDPGRLTFAPGPVQLLSEAEQANAQKIAAVDAGGVFERPLAQLLAARASSEGEFVVLAAPRAVPIARVQVAVSSRASPKVGAVPSSFYLVTNDRVFDVTLPESAKHTPGEVFEVRFPEPLASSCVSLVSRPTSPSGLAHADPGGVEIVAFSAFDSPGATLDAVAASLGGKQAEAAAQVLERAGTPAVAATARVYASLDARGRALAVDVAAASTPCEEGGPLLASALCEKEGEAGRKAIEKVARCPAVMPALAESLRADPSRSACLADTLATLAPRIALEPIADAFEKVPEADGAARSLLRDAFARALAAQEPQSLDAILGESTRSQGTRLELLRAADERVVRSAPAADGVLDQLMEHDPSFRTRYLVLGPLGLLARSGDRRAEDRLSAILAGDPDGPVRARAAEVSAGVAPLTGALAARARDPEPRVRQAALASLIGSSEPDAVRAATEVMSSGDWSYVKTRAAALLARAPASSVIDDVLGKALGDPLVSVRGAALVALAERRAHGWSHAIRERLDDDAEDIHIRAAAAGALGAVCDRDATDRLTDLARALAAPASAADTTLGLAALVGLGALHPADIDARLTPLLAASTSASVKAAVARARSARGACP